MVRILPARKAVAVVALLGAGALTGGLVTMATTASADPTPSASTSASPNGGGKGSADRRVNETPLTGDTLAKVKAAVLARYPNATFDRVETDSDGVYEAHITTSAGDRITVELDKNYAITGTEASHGGRGHGGPGGGENGETPLTGDTLAKVKAAVLAKYPDATFDRVETDSDGVYEAHITTKAGDRVTVELDKNYAVTGTE